MRFYHKITLAFLALLAAALCAVGLAMTAASFSAGLASARAAALAQHSRDRYGVEQAVYAQYETGAAYGAQPYGNDQLAAALQTYAAQAAPGAQLALFADGTALFSTLPTALPRAVQQQAAAGGAAQATVWRGGGESWLLLAQPLAVPGRDAVLLGAYDLGAVYAARRALLLGWAAAAALTLVLGGAAAGRLSRRLTAPLARLQAASGRIAAGEYGERTGIVTGDEIGALSASFDAMAEAVQRRIQDLHAALQRERDFVAAFTHELKTPMTSMMGYAGLLRTGPQTPAAVQDAAGYIYRETRRLEALCAKLLELLGLEAGEGSIVKAPVSDRALFAAVQRALAGPGAGDAAAPVVFAPGGCTVCVDRILWEDLLRNLVANACRACRGVPGAGVRVACRAEEGQAVFTVADTGCGIPPEDLPRVTEPFYMVDKSRARAGGGSGLGLALCSRIAACHGAALALDSAPGRGTTVTVRLPLAGGPQETAQTAKEGTNDES